MEASWWAGGLTKTVGGTALLCRWNVCGNATVGPADHFSNSSDEDLSSPRCVGQNYYDNMNYNYLLNITSDKRSPASSAVHNCVGVGNGKLVLKCPKSCLQTRR